MVLLTGKSVHARHRDGPHRHDDPRKAPPERRTAGTGFRRGLIGLVLLLATALPGFAEGLRVATYNADLSRAGPGLLLRDILRDDPQVLAAADVIAAAAPDILLLTGFDWDHDGQALTAFGALLAQRGLTLDHRYAPRPNTGQPTGLDLDGNGRLGQARDAQGFGRFVGQGGMALLSRYPIGLPTDHSGYLWRYLPLALIGGEAEEALAVQRLSTTGHWQVPVLLPPDVLPGGRLTLLAWHATPPVFDGPEDRNGRRNHDEAAFWLRLLDGDLPMPPPDGPLVVLGQSNLDPEDGEGRRDAIRAMLSHSRLQDTRPAATGKVASIALAKPPRRDANGQRPSTGANSPDGGQASKRSAGRGVQQAAVPAAAKTPAVQHGDPTLDTAQYDGIGGLRVDLVLPSADLRVRGAGLIAPDADDPLAAAVRTASHHLLVWVDIAAP